MNTHSASMFQRQLPGGHAHHRPGAASPVDSGRFAALTAGGIAVDIIRSDDGSSQLLFSLYANEAVPLRRVLPALQSMDLETLNEHTTELIQPDGTPGYIYDFVLQAGADAAVAIAREGSDADQHIHDTFHALWDGLADVDALNTLVVSAGLTWQQVSVLRSYSCYLRQTQLPYGQNRIERVLLDNAEAARATVDLFEARFGSPSEPVDHPRRIAAVESAQTALNEQIDQVVTIDADRILQAFRGVVTATVRTNSFAPRALSADVPYLAHKIRAQDVAELPEPRPVSEIFVCSPTVEGVHLRFGLVARGGLRWSDRLDDYRTEVLGLAKAQAVKNAVIVPAGAKGAFVVKRAPTSIGGVAADPETVRAHTLACYRQFIAGLLDMADNLPASGTTGHSPADIVCYDGADPYLVVAADKGTATFSDTANSVALERNYWLGDAFASGGSAGYDHKAMGITARGAWVSADSHLRELGIDTGTDEFTVVGIGDMSGDVFGNGMLLRSGIRLVGAFDHRHIFIDPTPVAETAYRERRRLFDLPRSSWADYNRTLLSAGGGIWPRSAKRIPVSAQMRAALGIDDAAGQLTPTELIRHILSAPVDLLWNGGVGTYVKSSTEQHADVGDKVNDAVRIDASDVRARVVAEGGNLGISPQARIDFSRNGGLINSDAIDNAAGVDCSDHEVNIKILLDCAPATSDLSSADRGDLLAQMTDEVRELVLANNRAHNRLLSDSRFNAAQMVDVHARMTASLEERRGLHRDREHLPSKKQYGELSKNDSGLTTPQLATLMAHVKLDLKADLIADEQFDDTSYSDVLEGYFPSTLQDRLGSTINAHPLHREIVATALVNRVVGTSGITYAFRLADEIGATTADIVRAHTIASRVFKLDELWAAIYDSPISAATANALILESRRLLDRASRWLLLNRPQPLAIGAEVTRFAGPLGSLSGQVGSMLRGAEKAALDNAYDRLVEQGVDASIAQRISEALYVFSLLDIVEVADAHDGDLAMLAQTYFALSDHLGIDRLLIAVSALPRGRRWHALSRLALREDLYRALRTLAIDVVAFVADSPGVAEGIEEWEQFNRPRLARARATLQELLQSGTPDLAALSVATAQIRRLTASPG